jgi:lysophospholipase L1-like esterase
MKSFLALGDSYTIGEAVEPAERWSHQVCDMLQANGIDLAYPKIIAKTGWTTSELQLAIADASIDSTYDFVTLLIGVNNQYRGESLQQFEIEFDELLHKAIALADGDKSKVLVISIPDWGVTPFAEGRDRNQISIEIDAFNQSKRNITMKAGVRFVDITPISRKAANDLSLNASDGLHPSGRMYFLWAEKITELIRMD